MDSKEIQTELEELVELNASDEEYTDCVKTYFDKVTTQKIIMLGNKYIIIISWYDKDEDQVFIWYHTFGEDKSDTITINNNWAKNDLNIIWTNSPAWTTTTTVDTVYPSNITNITTGDTYIYTTGTLSKLPYGMQTSTLDNNTYVMCNTDDLKSTISDSYNTISEKITNSCNTSITTSIEEMVNAIIDEKIKENK